MSRPALFLVSLYVPGPPALRRLATLLPAAHATGDGLLVELADLTPEAVLSACLGSGCGVVASRVIPPAHESAAPGAAPGLLLPRTGSAAGRKLGSLRVGRPHRHHSEALEMTKADS